MVSTVTEKPVEIVVAITNFYCVRKATNNYENQTTKTDYPHDKQMSCFRRGQQFDVVAIIIMILAVFVSSAVVVVIPSNV